MIESDVWKPVSTSPGIGGITGRDPAATRICAAVIEPPLDVEHLVADESGGGFDQGDVRRARSPVLAPADGDRVDATEHPVADRRPVGPVEPDVDPEAMAVPCLVPRGRPGARTSSTGCSRG